MANERREQFAEKICRTHILYPNDNDDDDDHCNLLAIFLFFNVHQVMITSKSVPFLPCKEQRNAKY